MVDVLESFESDRFGLLGLPGLTRCQRFQVDSAVSVSIYKFAGSTWEKIVPKNNFSLLKLFEFSV